MVLRGECHGVGMGRALWWAWPQVGGAGAGRSALSGKGWNGAVP